MTSHRLSTARSRLVATLAEEILQRSEPGPFAIESEHQLCRRFLVSRVTVRLALGDLENRGLIYRRHGKGTFAHGHARQAYRDIGFLVRGASTREARPINEMIRGAQSFLAPLRAAVVLLSCEPAAWRSEVAGSLAGVIVVPDGVTDRDLQVLRERKVPFLLALSSGLSGPTIHFGQQEAARAVTERLLKLGHRRFALLTGYHSALDAPKLAGIRAALRAGGLDPDQAVEFSLPDDEPAAPVIAKILALKPRPTALLALDDTLAARAAFHLRRDGGRRIPQDLSVVGFHDWTALHYVEQALTTVRFDFFAAGRHAAERLHHAALTGVPVTDLFFEPTHREGQTVAPPPVDETSNSNAAA